jgi:hypothetical protein
MGLFFVQDDPAKNAEYVAYIQDRTQPDWLRPIILHWYDTKWYFPRSDREYPNRVFGWTGPLPVGRLDDPHPPCRQEFDL